MNTFHFPDHDKSFEQNRFFISHYLFYSLMIFFVSICCMNCNTTKTNGGGGKGDIHKLGEVLLLNNKERVAIDTEGLKLKIDRIEESRCPLNVQCFQAGTAKVHLSVVKEDYVYMVDLKAKGNCQKTDGSCGNKVTTKGYTFTLVSLTPYPGEGEGQSINQDKYVAHVKVEK